MARRPAKPKHFATEAALCAAFLADIPPLWTAYAETEGWDILLVRKADGFQIGVQAKLRLNAHVIAQALEEWGSWSADRAGPDCRAILVPEAGAAGFEVIAVYIGLTVIRMQSPTSYRSPWEVRRYSPPLPGERGDESTGDTTWHEWAPMKRHKLPEYVPDVPAGAPSPRLLSQWKIKAIKVAITVERRGYITRADFKHLAFDHRRLLAPGLGWLTPGENGYVRSRLMPDLKKLHPRAYDQIAADFGKWGLPQMELQIAQGRQRAMGKPKALL